MLTEYFMQVKLFEENETTGLLEKIIVALDQKAEYYTEPMFAFSAGCGFISGYLEIGPHIAKDKESGRYATWYTYRITDYVDTLSEVWPELATKVESDLKSKIKDIKTGNFYRVTATDVPDYFKMIRKTWI